MGIMDFLEARIAEDETLARPISGDPCEAEDERIDSKSWPDRGSMVIYDEGGHTEQHAAHIVHWQPDRVLAECKAKRTIIDYESGDAREGDIQSGVLLAMALVYRDHPDFDVSWYDPHGKDLLKQTGTA